MKCAKCGNALQAGERFCGECGTPVTVATPSPIAVPHATAPDPVRQSVTPSPVVTTPPPIAGPPASRRGLFLGIGVMAVAAGGSGVGYFLRSRPNRLVVDASGSGDYRTIASAILGARPQDTIVLRPGTYKESLIVRSDVQIVGEGGRSVVIVEGAPGAHVFTFEGGSATLTGMTIRIVGTGTGTGAILVSGGTPIIEDCDLTSSVGFAVCISGAGANPVIRNCTMRDSLRYGVWVSEQGQGTIERCVISGNGLSGVAIKAFGNATVRDCQIRDGKDVGVYVYEQGQGTFTGNTLMGNASGAWNIETNAGKVTRTGNTPNA